VSPRWRPVATATAVLALAVWPPDARANAENGCPDLDGREDALVSGEILVVLNEVASSNAKEGCVVGHIAAAPAEVMAVLRDAGRYEEYMPTVKRSNVTVEHGDVLLNRQELDLPFPIGNRHFTIQLTEKRTDDGGFRLDFSYVPGSGNVKDTRGHWSVEPWRGGSLVAYVLWSDPGGAIPKWAVNRAARRTLPDVMDALRRRVLERAPGKPAAAGHPSS
jgi:hypothetical protein